MCLGAAPESLSHIKMCVKTDSTLGPVAIIGLKRSPKGDPDGNPLVHVRNMSAKPIARITFGVLAKSNIPGQIGDSSGWAPVERVLSPANEAWVHSTAVASFSLTSFARSIHSTCVYGLVVVAKVEFADGTVIEMNSDEKRSVVNALDVPREYQCDDSGIPESEWGHLIAFGLNGDRSSKNSEFMTESSEFTVTCEVRPDGRHLATMCPY
jgi:hypothetical protein